MLSDLVKQKIDTWTQKFPAEQKRSAVLQALHFAQVENGGWLSQAHLDAVADYLQVPQVAVYEVATFYSMYELKPIGRYKLSFCRTVCCQLAGAENVLEHLEQKLGIKAGETSADGLFTLREVECLAACGRGPVMQVNDRQMCENLTPHKIDVILAELRDQADGQ